MQKIAFGLRVRALFWGREKRGAPLTPNATLRKSMRIDWEWDAIFSRLQKGVYRWSGFIGCEKKMCFNWEWELFWEMRKSSGLVWEWEQQKRRARKPHESESNIWSEISGNIYNNKGVICAPDAVCEARRKFLREVDVLPARGAMELVRWCQQ